MELRGRRGADTGLYGISVASDLSGVGEQSLRAYEQHGLISPTRTAGGTRRYSDNDLDQIRRVTDLLDAGLNLAGVAMVLSLQDDNRRLRSELDSGGPSTG